MLIIVIMLICIPYEISNDHLTIVRIIFLKSIKFYKTRVDKIRVPKKKKKKGKLGGNEVTGNTDF